MTKVQMTLTVGRESSAEEIAAVEEAFASYGTEVRPNLFRASMELPMTLIIGLGTGIIGNALYDILKVAFKAVTDKRMKRKKTYAIIQQQEYEYIISKDKIAVRQRITYEQVEFSSLDEMIKYLEKHPLHKPEDK